MTPERQIAELLADAERYGEEDCIKAICPKDKSFADFVRHYRGPHSAIVVHTGEAR